MLNTLTLLIRTTRRIIMQKARGQAGYTIALPQFVGIRFQGLFHSPFGVLFTFPLRYWFTIGHELVFSLGRWSSRIPTGFHVSRGTQVPPAPNSISFTGLSPSMAGFSKPFNYRISDRVMEALQPRQIRRSIGLGCSPFARRY